MIEACIALLIFAGFILVLVRSPGIGYDGGQDQRISARFAHLRRNARGFRRRAGDIGPGDFHR